MTTSPYAKRFIAAGHAARPRADHTLGDKVAADKPHRHRILVICERAMTTRDCPLQHMWEQQDDRRWVAYGYGEDHNDRDQLCVFGCGETVGPYGHDFAGGRAHGACLVLARDCKRAVAGRCPLGHRWLTVNGVETPFIIGSIADHNREVTK